MRRVLASVLPLLPLLLLAPRGATACPACYLPGELAPSVKRARSIYVCQVVRALEPRLAEIRVVRVLRGPLKTNQLLRVPFHDPAGHRGKAALVIDPAEWGPLSPPLGVELEDEVRFLMQKRPRIASVAEAVRRVQGVSDEARAMGYRYVRRHHASATEPLIKEIERLKPLVFSGKLAFWDEHRLENLVRALLGKVDARTRAHALAEVDSFLRHPWRDASEGRVLEDPDLHAEYLEWLLSSVKRTSALRGELRRRLEAGLANLAGVGISFAVYALARSGTTPPASFRPLAHKEKTEAVAAGLYIAALRRARREGSSREARAFLQRARALTVNAALGAAVDDTLRTWK